MDNFTVSASTPWQHQQRYPTPSDLEILFLTLINSVNAATGLIGNVVVCVLVFRFHFLRMRAEILLGSLAIADMIVCVLAQPMYIAHIQNSNNFSPLLQISRKTVTWCAALASLNNIFVISLDRFLAVTFLQRYRAVMTPMSLKIVFGATWLVSLAMGISTAFSRKAKVLIQYYVIVILIAVFFLFARTLIMIRGKTLEIMRRLKEAESYQSQMSHLLPILNRERTLARMVGVVVGAFYVCFLPLVILPFFTVALRNSTSGSKAAWRAFPWVNTIALCSSSINPYIYYWRSARFRMALKRIRLTCLQAIRLDNHNIRFRAK